MNRPPPRWAAAPLAVLLVADLVGCGGDPDEDDGSGSSSSPTRSSGSPDASGTTPGGESSEGSEGAGSAVTADGLCALVDDAAVGAASGVEMTLTAAGPARCSFGPVAGDLPRVSLDLLAITPPVDQYVADLRSETCEGPVVVVP